MRPKKCVFWFRGCKLVNLYNGHLKENFQPEPQKQTSPSLGSFFGKSTAKPTLAPGDYCDCSTSKKTEKSRTNTALVQRACIRTSSYQTPGYLS